MSTNLTETEKQDEQQLYTKMCKKAVYLLVEQYIGNLRRAGEYGADHGLMCRPNRDVRESVMLLSTRGG